MVVAWQPNLPIPFTPPLGCSPTMWSGISFNFLRARSSAREILPHSVRLGNDTVTDADVSPPHLITRMAASAKHFSARSRWINVVVLRWDLDWFGKRSWLGYEELEQKSVSVGEWVAFAHWSSKVRPWFSVSSVSQALFKIVDLTFNKWHFKTWYK